MIDIQDVNSLPYNEILKRDVRGWISGKTIFAPLADEKYELIVLLLGGHKFETVRWRAANFLGELREKRAVPALCSALEDKEWIVRLHAANALGRIGDSSAVPNLLSHIQEHCYVQRRVVDALISFDTPEIRKVLSPLIMHKSPKMRWKISGFMQRSLDPLFIPHLVRALKTKDDDYVLPAAFVLARFGTKARKAVPVLDGLMQTLYNPMTRLHIIGVLGHIDTRRARRVLRKYTIDPDGGVSRRAKAALDYLKSGR